MTSELSIRVEVIAIGYGYRGYATADSLVRWMREKHHLFISVKVGLLNRSDKIMYYSTIIDLTKDNTNLFLSGFYIDNYDAALEEALYESLKLINKNKNNAGSTI